MTDPDDYPAPDQPLNDRVPAPVAAVVPTPAERIKSARSARLAAALRSNLKRRKRPTAPPRDDRH